VARLSPGADMRGRGRPRLDFGLLGSGVRVAEDGGFEGERAHGGAFRPQEEPGVGRDAALKPEPRTWGFTALAVSPAFPFIPSESLITSGPSFPGRHDRSHKPQAINHIPAHHGRPPGDVAYIARQGM